MVNKLTIFLSATLLVATVQAQPTFEKVYDGTGATLRLSELSNGHIFSDIAWQSGVTLMGAEGNVLNTHCYTIILFLVLQSVLRRADNQFYFTSLYYGDTCDFQFELPYRHLYPVLGKMDSLGNIMEAKYYMLNTGCQNNAGPLTITADGGVITWGDGVPGFFALRADSNFAHVWSKHFDHHGSFQFIKELPDGDLIAGINMDTAGVAVARMDASGNFIWCKSYIRPKGMIHDCVVESDSSFLITGVTDSIAAHDPTLFLMKLNGAGEVQWCKGYSTDQYWFAADASRLVKAHDGNYVLLQSNLMGDQGWRPWLIKLDPNGDTLWTRLHGVNTYGYVTKDLLATTDGGYLYDGWDEGGAAFLFKTDSLGMLPCHSYTAPPLYTTDFFPVDSDFVLTSIDGATTLPALVQDTVYPPFSVTDGCDIVEMSVPTSPVKRPHIHPNPTAGHFILSFTDPLMAESYYSVYDTMGRLLYQRPLPQGAATEDVDLSRFGKGTYVIKFTEKVGTCYERVVVE